ncbi:hypothetical protein BRC81_06705 [Halobacteriales archaeon QS_1_68_20]|nr:MAG: hypothetical protein BRC81_06705 [Halobacteriales archaeon QS_1_68_20]
MSDDSIRRTDVVSKLTDRRGFLEGAATASLVGLAGFTGSAAGAEVEPDAVPQDLADAVFASRTGGVLERLSDEGVLPEASVDALPTTPTTTGLPEEGVARTGDVYVARRHTDDALVTVLARRDSEEAIGVVSPRGERGVEVYDETGEIDPAGACSCTDELCFDLESDLTNCWGIPSGCC